MMKRAMFEIKKFARPLALAGISLCLSAAASAKTDYASLNKELEIMTSIMQTAMKQSNRRTGIRFRSVDATYLAGQGVVFNVRTSNSGWGINLDFGDIMPVVPPTPPVHVMRGDNSFTIELDEHELQMMTEDALRVAQEALRMSSDQLRELRAREREIAWEQREYERRRRDIEFEKRNADEERRKELNEELREMDAEMKALEQKQAEVNEYASQLEQEQKQKVEKQKQAKEQEHKRFLAEFESGVGDILCSYGAGLKALPADENVSFLLSDFGVTDRQGQQDRIYVFSLKDIRACVQDKIKSEKLLANATSYMF